MRIQTILILIRQLRFWCGYWSWCTGPWWSFTWGRGGCRRSIKVVAVLLLEIFQENTFSKYFSKLVKQYARLALICVSLTQCSGSVTFWYGSGCGSGSLDPCLRLTDPASDPALFVSDLQDANKKYFFSLCLYAYSFLKVHWHPCSRKKRRKEVTKQYRRNQLPTNNLRIQIQEAQKPKLFVESIFQAWFLLTKKGQNPCILCTSR